MKCIFPAVLAVFLGAGLHAQPPGSTPSSAASTQPTPRYSSNHPTMKAGERFLERHKLYLARGKNGPIGVLFLGDSITERWETNAPQVWKQYYEKYQPANFGISGDLTEHVLWRIDHGELEDIDPKVTVLMIGTNNTETGGAEEITAGIKAIVQRIQKKLPNTKILLLGIFPRGPMMLNDHDWDDGVASMEKIKAVNLELAKMENGSTLRYLDITPKLLDAQGKIPSSVMPDQLHPGEEGYKIWAAAMQPLLKEMLADRTK